MTHLIRIATITALASLLLAACGGTTLGSTAPLDGQWEIERIADESGTLSPPVDDTSPFLSFTDLGTDEAAVAGNTGCNSFSGPVAVETDGSFEAGNFMMTLMGCPDARGGQEESILSHMSAADAWSVDGDVASLSVDGEVGLALRRIDMSLEGSAWLATGINNQADGVRSVVIGTEPTLIFESDRRLTGTTGCNDLNGSYVVDDDAIEIGPVATTRKFCQTPDGVMGQEQNMTAALENATTYEISGFSLTLMDADGATMLNAVRIDEPRS
jgi:heat shock protein HslJ